jgi:hypothetical protein
MEGGQFIALQRRVLRRRDYLCKLQTLPRSILVMDKVMFVLRHILD